MGIPIQLEKSHGILKEFFAPGLTDQLRKTTKEFIEKNLKEKKIQANVTDLGEILSKEDHFSKDNELIGISKSCLDGLAKELKRRIKGMDFLIVYGGIHTGAYLLYHLPGKVERFDFHEDDNDISIPFHTSYMKYANSLKDSSQVSTHSWTDLLDGVLDAKPVGKPIGKIFDIDVDYYTSTEYCKIKGDDEEHNFNRIISAVQKAKPVVIGLFEFQRLDKSGYKKMLEIVWSGIR